MFSEIRIQNFKSIQDLTLKPGRVTVLIGENGSGKSNILEAIAFAAGASANKLDNPFLSNRGVRTADLTWMKSAFPRSDNSDESPSEHISFLLHFSEDNDDHVAEYIVTSKEDNGYTTWNTLDISKLKLENSLNELIKSLEEKRSALEIGATSLNTTQKLKLVFDHTETLQLARDILKRNDIPPSSDLLDFVIFAPENTALRRFEDEGAIQPLGVKGEGLLKVLHSFAAEANLETFRDINCRLRLFGWFDGIVVPDTGMLVRSQLHIRDKWLEAQKSVFDQRSANEGFLFVLFYLALLMSDHTPKFFAIDNIDTALNPRLAAEMMKQVVELAKIHGKQVICTTHNPAILDGLDLHNDDQRLFVVKRDSEGRTVVRRVYAPEPSGPDEPSIWLSEAFMRGIIGGLPNNF